MMFEVEPLSASSRYMRTTWMLSADTQLRLSDFLTIRLIGKDETDLLAESVRKRNVFVRHYRENDFYLKRLNELSDHTIIEVSLSGDPGGMAEEVEAAVTLVELAEKVAVLSTTLAMTKAELQHRLGISSKRTSELDFAYDSQFEFLRSRSKTTPTARGIRVDGRFCNRFHRCGFHRLTKPQPPRNDLAKRVLMCLDWVYESRLEPRLEASVVKTAVALESLLVFSASETLARSLSERTAFILSSSPDVRREISGIIKRFYEVRSGVVHGSRKKASKLTPSLAEAVDRLSVLLCLTIAANYDLWSSVEALREWCEGQRWGNPSTDTRIPFAHTYVNNAMTLGNKLP